MRSLHSRLREANLREVGLTAGKGLRSFWARIGNATKQLHGDDMVEYQSDHWG